MILEKKIIEIENKLGFGEKRVRRSMRESEA